MPPSAPLPTDRPLVVWDGECWFCRRWMKRYHALAGDRLDFAPLSDAAEHFPTIPRADFERAIHLISPDGTHVSGAAAMFGIMDRLGLRRWPLRLYRHLPPFRGVTNVLYRWIAGHRAAANTISTLAWGRVETPSTWLLTRRVFLRLMGLIYLIAFVSLGTQVLGLIGSQGLHPAEVFMNAVSEHESWWRAPTMQWLGGDGMLTATWIIGAVSACLLMLGVLPLLCSAVCWAMYLSLVTAGSVFLQYQWDALLLEAGILAVLWCPWTWRLNSIHARRPSRLIHWLIVILLARLVVFASIVKLQSGDPAWADCTALSYHFWTQPLPWWPAWVASTMPASVLRFGCILMFIIELGAPILLLLPRLPRTIGAGAIILLMLGIAATGNYGFFNWLTIVLCIAMLDDAVLLMLWPRVVRSTISVGLRAAPIWQASWLRRVSGVVLLSLVGIVVWHQTAHASVTAPLQSWDRAFAPWRLVGGYGLFASMTKTRPEITIEAQLADGSWAPYVFRWKAGPLDRVGRLSQPGMPRLDWQLWFDGLSYERAWESGALRPGQRGLRLTGRKIDPVLPQLLRRLAVGDPAVLQLLESSPLGPGERPAALRWHLDQYRFTSPQERSATGDWWSAERLYRSGPLRYSPQL